MSTDYALPKHSAAGSLAPAIDRWIYVFMVVWFIAIVLAGFIPDSLMKIGMVQAGVRPPFPPILHVHAILMGSFLLLLLAQSWLMASGRRSGHQSLGRVAFVLVPALVVVGFILAPTMYQQIWHGAQAAPPPMQEKLRQLLRLVENILLLQLQAGIVFAICIALALRARRIDSDFHKRMMFLATAVPLGAAFDRMQWLPSTMPANPLSLPLYVMLAVTPMFLWDVIRHRNVHRAYFVWLGVYLPITIAVILAWDTPGWHAFASRALGP